MMVAALDVGQQLQAIIDRIKAEMPALRTVTGVESLDEATAQGALLPAAVVVWAGDKPERPGPGLTAHPGQKLLRHWFVFLVLELTRGPEEGMVLAEQLAVALTGWRICRGTRYLAHAGSQFEMRFDRTRVIYSVRFAEMTAIKP